MPASPRSLDPAFPPHLLPHLLRLNGVLEVETFWETLRALLPAAISCSRITLFLGHLGLGEARKVFTDPPIPRTSEWYEERGRINPFSPWIQAHPGVEIYRFTDITGPPATFRRTDFYRRFARAEGWDKGLSGLFWQRHDMRAMFSLYRRPRLPDFTAAEMDLLRALRPPLEAALIRVQTLHHERALRRAYEEFARALPTPMLLLDWSEKVVFANAEAHRAAAHWNFGPRSAGVYNFRESFRVPFPVQETIAALKSRLLQLDPRSLPRRHFEPVTLTHPKYPRLQATLRISGPGAGLARPWFFVQFQETPARAREVPATAGQSFQLLAQLTPGERQVARLVTEGLSNAEVARRLRKSVLTVKTQLHSVYQKLDLRRRTQLAPLFSP